MPKHHYPNIMTWLPYRIIKIIYSTQPIYPEIQQLTAKQEIYVSTVRRIEVLGYHNLLPADRIDFENFFRTAIILPIASNIIDASVDREAEAL